MFPSFVCFRYFGFLKTLFNYAIGTKRYSGENPIKEVRPYAVDEKCREYFEVRDFIFRNLRHTPSRIMVSSALGKGVGLAEVMKILGHSQVETTMSYLHADFGKMKAAMEALERKTKKK